MSDDRKQVKEYLEDLWNSQQRKQEIFNKSEVCVTGNCDRCGVPSCPCFCHIA